MQDEIARSMPRKTDYNLGVRRCAPDQKQCRENINAALNTPQHHKNHGKLDGINLASYSRVRVLVLMTLFFILAPNLIASALPKKTTLLPPVIEVHRQAVKHSRLDLAQIASWKKRSRLAALVPRLQVDFGKRVRNDIDIDIDDNVYVGSSGIIIGPEEGGYSNGHTSDLSIGVRAVWELGEVIFNPRALAVSAEARHVARERNLLLTDVNRHYFVVESFSDEMRLLNDLMKAAKKPEKLMQKILQKRLACKESSAALDALTGGWWSHAIDGHGKICGEKR